MEYLIIESGEDIDDAMARLRAIYLGAVLVFTELRTLTGEVTEGGLPEDPPFNGGLHRVRYVRDGHSFVSYAVTRFRHPDGTLQPAAPL